MFGGQARRKAVLFSFIFAAILMAQAGTARAVDATLNIKARLVKCVSPQERRALCSSENLCCQYIDGFAQKITPGERLSSLDISQQPGKDTIWIAGPERPSRLSHASR